MNRRAHRASNMKFLALPGAERAAALYSPIGTAKLNGIERGAYLRPILEAHS